MVHGETYDDKNIRDIMEDNSDEEMDVESSTTIDSAKDSGEYDDRECTGLLSSYHGVVYQVQWLMAVALESYDRLDQASSAQGTESCTEFKFRKVDFRTEDPDAGKFDDLTWRYKTGEIGKYDYYFLQAKHKLNKEGKEKITLEDLLKSKQKDNVIYDDSSKPSKIDKRPFALEKYFKSYKEDIKRNEKYRNCRKLNLIIATNIDFDVRLKESLQPHSIPIIEYMEQKVSRSLKCYKFRKPDNDNLYVNQIIEYLGKTHELKSVVSKLMEHVTKDEDISKDTEVVGRYFSDLLACSIIDISGKFDESFIRDKNLSYKAKKFRNALFQIGYCEEKKNASVDFVISHPDGLAAAIATQIKKQGGKPIIKIEQKSTVIKENINKLANFVFVQDSLDKEGVKFSDSFLFGDEVSFPKGNLIEFKRKLLDRLEVENDDCKSLTEYRFKITGNFVTCKELTISETAFWDSLGKFNKFHVDRETEEMRNNHSSILEDCVDSETQTFSEEFKYYPEKFDDKPRKFQDFLLEKDLELKRKIIDFDTVSDSEELGKTLAQRIIKSIEKNEQNGIKIERKGKIFTKHIDKLANYVLIEDDLNKCFVKFSSSFLEGIDFPSEKVRKFKDSLIRELDGLRQDTNHILTECRFMITGKFETCPEMFTSQKAYWEGIEKFGIEKYMERLFHPTDKVLPEKDMDDVRAEAEDFLDNLVFIVDCSQSVLQNLIKRDCISFTGIDTDYVAYEFQVRMSDCLNLQVKGYICTAEGVREFINQAKIKIHHLTLLGPTIEYQEQLKKYGVEFEKEIVQQEYFSDEEKAISTSIFTSTAKVLNINTENVTLTALKVFQAIRNRIEGSYIFMRLPSILSMKKHVKQAFTKINLLIIVCDGRTDDFDNLYRELKNIQRGRSNKKIALITKESDKLVNSLGEQRIYDRKNGFSNFTMDSQEILLKRECIIFQGRSAKLNILNQDLLEQLHANILFRIIKDERIKIGGLAMNSRVKDMRGFYIERNFYQRVIVSDKFRKKKSEFLILEETDTENGNIERSKHIIVISDSQDKFDELIKKYSKCNIHWITEIEESRISSSSKHFLWRRSHGSIVKLRSLIAPREYQIDHEKFQMDLKNNNAEILIISAIPGMGKSTFLDHLALQMKTDDEAPWVVNVNLLNHAPELAEFQNFRKSKTPKKLKTEKNLHMKIIILLYKMTNLKISEACEGRSQLLQEVIKSTRVENGKIHLKDSDEIICSESKLELKVFNSFFNENNITFLFDGFDEINPNYKGDVIEILKFLKDKKSRIWITTRPYNYILKNLENRLGTFSFTLLPLSEKGKQKDFLRKYWQKHLNHLDINEGLLDIFIEKIFEKFSEKKCFKSDFLEVPLHLYMVARILKGDIKDSMKKNLRAISSELDEKIGEKLDLGTLYERFYEIKFKEFYRKEHADIARDLHKISTKIRFEKEREERAKDHERLALFRMFDKRELATLLVKEDMKKTSDSMKEIKKAIEKTGIIKQIVGKKPIFVHMTFAEYFTARFVWDKFKSIEPKNFDNFLEKFVILKLVKGERILICRFIQSLALKDKISSVDPMKMHKFLEKLVPKMDPLVNKPSSIRSNPTVSILLRIIEHFLSKKSDLDKEICCPETSLKRWKVMSISCKMGYSHLLKKCSNISQKDFNKFCKLNWKNNPLWLAAENDRINVLHVLKEFSLYDINLRDETNNNFIKTVFHEEAWNVLLFSLKQRIIKSTSFKYIADERLSLLVASLFVRLSKIIVGCQEKGFIETTLCFNTFLRELLEMDTILFGSSFRVHTVDNNAQVSERVVDPSLQSGYSSQSKNLIDNGLLMIKEILKCGFGYNRLDRVNLKSTATYVNSICNYHSFLEELYEFCANNNDLDPICVIVKLMNGRGRNINELDTTLIHSSELSENLIDDTNEQGITCITNDALETSNIQISDIDGGLRNLMIRINSLDSDLLSLVCKKLEGEQNRLRRLQETHTFAKLSSGLHELYEEMNDLYKQLVYSIDSGDIMNVKNLLFSEKHDFIKSVVNAQDPEYGSPLHFAAYKGNKSIVEQLLKCKVDPNLKLDFNECSKMVISDQDKSILQDQSHLESTTSLNLASLSDNVNVVESRLRNEAEGKLILRDQSHLEDATPLHLASLSGNVNVVELLLRYGADPKIENRRGKTPLFLVLKKLFLNPDDRNLQNVLVVYLRLMNWTYTLNNTNNMM